MRAIVFCHQCRYWEQLGEMGLCRRRAPRAVPTFGGDDDEMRARWPETDHNDWCGEGRGSA